MPFGLILPPALAIWLILGSWGDKLKAWRLNRLSAVILLLVAIVLSYIDLLLGEYYFNLGGLFVLGFGIWLFFLLPRRNKWRAVAAAIIIAGLLIVIQSGLLWQLDQANPPASGRSAITDFSQNGGYAHTSDDKPNTLKQHVLIRTEGGITAAS